MITHKMAESIRQLGFAAEPGTIKTQRRFEGIAGVIRDLFETSANYCLELEAGAPHPQSRQTTPDGVASAQAAQVPPAPATKEDRGGKQVRWNAPIERVKQKIRQLQRSGIDAETDLRKTGQLTSPQECSRERTRLARSLPQSQLQSGGEVLDIPDCVSDVNYDSNLLNSLFHLQASWSQ